MPITIGQLNNVPAPGDPITSPWAQQVSPLAVHHFANKAALDAQWGSAPDGSLAVTVDNFRQWMRRGGAWSMVMDYGLVPALSFASGTGACPHGLGRVPVSGLVIPGQALNIVFQIQGLGGTTITIRAITVAGTPATFTGTSNVFYWVA